MHIQLPTQKIAAYRKDPKLLLIYGPPKIGKTTILSQLENNLIIDTEERGTDYIEALKIKVANLQDYETTCNLLKLKTPRPYRYISLDTIDKIEEWCEWEATRRYKASTLGKGYAESSVLNLPRGAGYHWLRETFKDYIQKLANCADNIIYVGHIRDKNIESGGKEVSTTDLDLTGKIKSIMCSNVDAIGYLTVNKYGCWTITFQTQESTICGSRCDHLRGQTFVMEKPRVFDWGKIYIEDKNGSSSNS